MYVTFGAVPESAPCAGWLAIAYVRSSPSASVAVRTIATDPSSSTLTLWLFATGGVFVPASQLVTITISVVVSSIAG